MHCRYVFLFTVLLALLPVGVSHTSAQSAGDTRPTIGLRENPPRTFLLRNARVVVQPGQVLERASLLIRGEMIHAVGDDVAPPAGAAVIDCEGRTIYAGLIDAYHEIDVPSDQKAVAAHWNGNVLPRRSASSALRNADKLDAWRAQGITMRLLAPKGAIVKGTSCLVQLDGDDSPSLVRDRVAQHLQLTVPRGERRDEYPNSPMGAVALVRQTLSDAQWYPRAWEAYRSQPQLQRPTTNADLEQLAVDLHERHFVIDAPNERMALRAEQIAREFSLPLIMRGSGREYRDLKRIAATGRMILVPVDFPEAPHVASEAAAAEVNLQTLMHWHFAKQNPAKLAAADVRFCLTADGLDDPKKFLEKVRIAVRHGLSPEDALAALTTVPAAWLEAKYVTGRVQPGEQANLLVTEGDLFDEKTKVLETWVAGRRFRHDTDGPTPHDPLLGTWKSSLRPNNRRIEVRLELEQDDSKLSGKLTKASSANKNASADDPPSAKLRDLARSTDRMTAWVDLSEMDAELPSGATRVTIVTLPHDDTTELFSTLTWPDGGQTEVQWQPVQKPDENKPEENGADDTKDAKEANNADPSTETDAAEQTSSAPDALAVTEIPVNFPLGAYGLSESPPKHSAVMFRRATVWTCGEAGILSQADVLVVDGKIAAVGPSLDMPEGCHEIDAKGKHLTPGIIDCHSHMATDGGVNESGQAVTAEVRVGDFVDHTDINIYRQLAGGVTVVNILHGSANPIGGQNQVIKLRWGDGMEEMKMKAAPAGIKFALGENVKRSNYRSASDRYPASRMGVEQIMRDRFLAAQEYDRRHRQWHAGQRNGLPPRRDLELEAIAEILNGDRWIHCHSYRQDEIITLLDLLDRFDVTIGTLQHILEGYKVADRMLQHGAMGSSFSDWWAYKFEVYDAIPYNGAIMHDVGVVVSFNSDDAELARHLNTEAAKATLYGEVPPEEALKFVTLNPAKQLRIDHRVGSIETGKDADLVLWNGPPLSTLSRCEQTWVDGQVRFSLELDKELRDRDAAWRSSLIQAILQGDAAKSSSEAEEVPEEKRWLRYDEFCHVHDHDGHDHDGHHHSGAHHHQQHENDRAQLEAELER